MFGLAFSVWEWVAIGLFCVGLFFAGFATHAVRSAEEKGQLKADLATANATLTGLQAQEADLKAQVAKSDAAAARIPPVLVQWQKDTNSMVIAPGCEAAMQFTRARVPVLVTHRRMEVVP